jgi:hypothetical protein
MLREKKPVSERQILCVFSQAQNKIFLNDMKVEVDGLRGQ